MILDSSKVYWRLCVKIHFLDWYNSWSMFETSSKADKKWANIWCRRFSSIFFVENCKPSDQSKRLIKNGDHLRHKLTSGGRAQRAWAQFIRAIAPCWSISSRQILSSNVQCKFRLIFRGQSQPEQLIAKNNRNWKRKQYIFCKEYPDSYCPDVRRCLCVN